MATAQPLNPELLLPSPTSASSWWTRLTDWLNPPSTSSLAVIPAQGIEPTPIELLRIAISQKAGIDQLTKLMDFKERWEKNEARKAYVVAMNAFKATAPELVKNTTATFQTKKGDTVSWDYASLDHICDAVIGALSQHGITHCWSFEQPSTDLIRVSCQLTHALGHSQQTTLQGPPDFSGDKSPIHAVYSTVTHLERYTLLAATGLAAAEVDAESEPKEADAPKNQVREYCALIANAENLDKLHATFRAAYSDATDAGDKNAQAAYIKAKDARRRQIR